jgi:hypothetical protein
MSSEDQVGMLGPSYTGVQCLWHNPNRDHDETVAEYIDRQYGREFPYRFKDVESRQRCVDTDQIWVLSWYPKSPAGFIAIAAPTFYDLLVFVGSGFEANGEQHGFPCCSEPG